MATICKLSRFKNMALINVRALRANTFYQNFLYVRLLNQISIFSTTLSRNRIFSYYSTNVTFNTDDINSNLFERVCEETLESLTDFFEELAESKKQLEYADISYSSGVLTMNLGKYGTYVINRQSPNKQIWLSSPSTGPKRYDYVVSGSFWIYKHDNKTLHQLLQEEISLLLNENVDLSKCLHSKIT